MSQRTTRSQTAAQAAGANTGFTAPPGTSDLAPPPRHTAESLATPITTKEKQHASDVERDREREAELKQGEEHVEDGLKGAWHAFHGAGEALRGAINGAADRIGEDITGTKARPSGNDDTLRSGEQEMHKGRDLLQ